MPWKQFLLTSTSPGSIVRSRRNYRVESKIELNLLEGLLLRKKTWIDIPDRLQFSLSSIFSKWLIFATGLWSVENQWYQIYCLETRMAESWQELVTSHTQVKLFLIVRLYNRWVPYRSYLGSQFVFFFWMRQDYTTHSYNKYLVFIWIFVQKFVFQQHMSCLVLLCLCCRTTRKSCFFLAATKLYWY